MTKELAGYDATGPNSVENLGILRSSSMQFETADDGTATLTVDATTVPVRAALTGPRSVLTPHGKELLKSFMAKDPSMTENDVLSALRAHAALDSCSKSSPRAGSPGTSRTTRPSRSATVWS